MRIHARKWIALVLAGAAAVFAVNQAGAAPSGQVQGEVRKIDAAAGKITLKHGPIAELELPAMTLVYVVQDPAVLNTVKPGDTVRFVADKVDGRYTVISISK